MCAGWIRPSRINLARARRPISRRTESKHETVTESGVSSTITSTPAACSKALMLRPFRPTIRPFISSLGSVTTARVTSATCSDATRWMASAISLRARFSPCSRASASIWRMMRAMSPRASFSTAVKSSFLASSGVIWAMNSSFLTCSSYSLSISLPRRSTWDWRLLICCSRCSSRSTRLSSSARRLSRRSVSLLSSMRRSLISASAACTILTAFSRAWLSMRRACSLAPFRILSAFSCWFLRAISAW